MKNHKSIERGEEDASYNLCTGIFWENSIQRGCVKWIDAPIAIVFQSGSSTGHRSGIVLSLLATQEVFQFS